MGNLSNLFISQSFISVLHTGNNNTLSAQYTDIQDGLGNSSGVSLKTNGDLSMSGSLTASLQQGYVWVGNASGRTTTVPTSSFGGGGSATWPVSGTPSGIVSGSSQLTASYDTRYALSGSGGGTLPSGVVSGSSQINYPQISNIPSGIVSGAAQITPLLPSGVVSGSGQISGLGFVSSSVTGSSVVTASFSGNTLTFTKGNGTTFGVVIPDVSGSTINTGSFITSIQNNPLTPLTLIYDNALGSTNVTLNLPSGIVSGSSQLTSSYDLRYALSGSGGGGGATLGSNTFIGNQTITGSLFISSSGVIDIIAPNFPGAPAPGGVSVTGSLAVNGNFAVNGGNFVVGQINTPKIVGNGSPGLDIVSNVQIYNDGNINNARILGVSGSVHVSQSLYTGDLYVGGNKQFNVAEFFSTTTQSGSAGVSGSITFNNSGSVNGVSLANNTRITVANAGTYNIQFSAQVETNAGSDSVYIWFKKNGVNIPSSATKVVLANNTAQVMTVNILDEASTNDYYQLAYQTNNGHATLLAEVASGNIPAIPSVIATVTQVR